MIETNCEQATVEIIDPLYNISCVHHFFEYYADTYPDRTAIIGNFDSYTYEEAELHANALARHLQSLGAKPGAFIGIYFNRSEYPILATIAIMKSGACYIPIDPAYPKERIEHIVNDCGVSIILTEDDLKGNLSEGLSCAIVSLDGHEEVISENETTRVTQEESGVQPTDLSYIIYTSGSTGKPKGILTEHRNVVAFTHSFRKHCKLTYNDRVYQGFSMGFDGSVEEIWQCFSSGATLVTSSNDSAKLASEAAKIINQHKVTFFSTVPTFLAMIDEELPSVRLLILSGEPCRAELVNKWADEGRIMLNVYGPTETTVNTTSEVCVPGKEITIGKSLDGYDLYIVNEKMEIVSDGEKGELYIGGEGVARGYLHREELTAKTFLPNPFGTGRIYKTGDKVSLNKAGELLFHGRIDNQVKVRGYRIELSEIESLLLSFPEVQSAAVNVIDKGGMKHIAAFATASETLDIDLLWEYCSQKVPSYMMPSFFSQIEAMPKTASGKIDRNALPKEYTPFVKQNRNIVAPKSDTEELLIKVWKEVFQLEAISVEDNFFTDLGGYSLLAAELASILRARFDFNVPIRDIYDNPSITQLALRLEMQDETTVIEKGSAKEIYKKQGAIKRSCIAALQALSLLGLWSIRAIPFALLFFLWQPVYDGAHNLLSQALWGTVALSLGWWPLMMMVSIFGKWVLIGRYSVQAVPLWSFTYFRYWLSRQVQSLSGISHFTGTPIINLYYRLMGAKIGEGVILDTDSLVAYDLISIGDESAIASETQLTGYSVKGGFVHYGPVTIGERCFVGIHSCLSIGSIMEDESKLGDLTLLAEGAVAQREKMYQGAPAKEVTIELPQIDEERSGIRRPVLWGITHFIAGEFISMVSWLSNIPSMLLLWFAWSSGSFTYLIVGLLLSVPLSIVSYCVLVPLLKALILHKTKPGSYSVESLYYVRKWAVDSLMRRSRSYMHAIYTTIYLAPWLRLMGAKIGKMAEISTVSQVTPDLVHIEDESFFADGSMIGGRHFYRGYFRCDYNRIKKRSFVGNNAILPMGRSLGQNCLLGVLSYPPMDSYDVPQDSEWLGSPSFQLPHRVKVEGFAKEEIFTPTKKLYFQRYCIDALRILLPGFISLGSAILFFTGLFIVSNTFGVGVTFALLPLISLLSIMTVLGSVVLCKWLVMQKIKPEIKPLWCTYIWWNELVNGVHETVGAPIVSSMGGTPYINWYFRSLGSRIGKGVHLETTLFSEFDMVHIDDYCALNQGVVIQNHLFEDRIFKSSVVDLKEGVTIGNMAIVLYDAMVESDTEIDNLSLVMKGESIPAESQWSGIPVVRI